MLGIVRFVCIEGPWVELGYAGGIGMAAVLGACVGMLVVLALAVRELVEEVRK